MMEEELNRNLSFAKFEKSEIKSEYTRVTFNSLKEVLKKFGWNSMRPA